MKLLEQEAKRRDKSVNVLILKMIEQGLRGFSKKHRYHDLDHLSGSWLSSEEKIFVKNTKQFEKFDF